MANYFKTYTAEFHTAKDVYARLFETKVKASALTSPVVTGGGSLAIKVGSLVTFNSTTGELNLVTGTGTTSEAAVANPAVTDAMYIVAQSDMTLEYGHVPVENRDYRYSDAVADSGLAKKVALYIIHDPADVVLTVDHSGSYTA